MELELIMMVAGIGLLVSGVSQVLTRAGRDEQATLLSIAAIVTVLLIIVGQLGSLFDELSRVFGL